MLLLKFLSKHTNYIQLQLVLYKWKNTNELDEPPLPHPSSLYCCGNASSAMVWGNYFHSWNLLLALFTACSCRAKNAEKGFTFLLLDSLTCVSSLHFSFLSIQFFFLASFFKSSLTVLFFGWVLCICVEWSLDVAMPSRGNGKWCGSNGLESV